MIFIDTGALLARYVARDQHHAQAVARWEILSTSGESCFTSSWVIDETITLLTRMTTANFAVERARQLYSSQVLKILRPEAADEVAAMALLEKYASHKFSFTDCVSMILMRKYQIPIVFGFDDDFRIAGFTVVP